MYKIPVFKLHVESKAPMLGTKEQNGVDNKHANRSREWIK